LEHDFNHIEDLFRNAFSGYQVPPSPGLWKGLVRKLKVREFLRFDPSSFNMYYLGAIVTVGVAGVLLLGKPGQQDRLDTQAAQTDMLQAPEQDYEVAQPVQKEETPLNEAQNEATKAEAEAINNKTIKEQDARHESEVAEVPYVTPRLEAQESSQVAILKAREEDGFRTLMPLAAFEAGQWSGCVPFTVTFSNTSEYAESYSWNFGDGGMSEKKEPTYIFDEPGEYAVTLIAEGSHGKDVVTHNVTVFGRPKASFEIYPEDVYIPDEPVNFHNYSQNAERYRWDFGDGEISEAAEPVHYYKTTGNYNIRLIAWSAEGCVDSLTITNAFESTACNIQFPNAFRPNPHGPSNGYYTDGRTTNEVFHPVCKGVVEYQLRIYNRMGQLVFESNDVNIGWDGYVNDKLARPDVYIWKARGRFSNGQEFVKFGNVTLVKSDIN